MLADLLVCICLLLWTLVDMFHSPAQQQLISGENTEDDDDNNVDHDSNNGARAAVLTALTALQAEAQGNMSVD